MAEDKILVVEDSRLYRRVLMKALTDAGYRVETAANGKSGVEMASDAPPDLVITDMDMPIMSGDEVCRRLKAQANTQMVPIIMLTASETADKIEQLDGGADDYIPKSQDFAELLAKVRVFLRIKHLQDQLREQNEKLRYENEMNERELHMARDLQLGLLPQEGGRRGRLNIAFRYFPMRCVGGDLFDVVENSDGSTAFFISDVSGHGVGAAFVTAMIKTSVLAYSGESASVGDLSTRVKCAIANLVGEGTFVTAFFGLLNSEATRIEYISAGHMLTLLIHPGEASFEQLDSTNLPLGVGEDFEFQAQSTPVSVGDRLILFTDGIIEAPNEAEEQFGMSRFTESILSHRGKDLEGLVGAVIEDLIEFSGNDTFDDDVNLVACEVVEA